MKIHPIVSQVVNRQHVSKTNREIIEAVWRALSNEGRRPENRDTRKEFYRQAILQHKHNVEDYCWIMRGCR